MKLSRDTLNSFLAKLLKPIVRFCIKHAVSYQDLKEILKESYLKEADIELNRTDQKKNISRLSVLTGINRKEVKRLLSIENAKEDEESLIFKVLGKWQSSKIYSQNNKAKKLTCGKIDSEFSKLVESISTDFNPATVLFQLERLDLVKTENSLVELLEPEYIPTENVDLQLTILSKDTSDLMSAVTENVLDQKEIPNLHRRTMYDNIDPNMVDKIKDWIMLEGLELHKKARDYISQYDLDINPKKNFKEKGAKVVLGTFSNVESGKEE